MLPVRDGFRFTGGLLMTMLWCFIPLATLLGQSPAMHLVYSDRELLDEGRSPVTDHVPFNSYRKAVFKLPRKLQKVPKEF